MRYSTSSSMYKGKKSFLIFISAIILVIVLFLVYFFYFYSGNKSVIGAISAKNSTENNTNSAIAFSGGLPISPTVVPWKVLQNLNAEKYIKSPLEREKTLGNKESARVIVVEYASLTCTHCAVFTTTVFPDFKRKYIDTGKVYYVYRDFPLDIVAAMGSMLARCIAPDNVDRYFMFIEKLFKTQDKWAFQKGPVQRLEKQVQKTGMTRQQIKECLDNKNLLTFIKQSLKEGEKVLKITGTPTFFINGHKLTGGFPREKFLSAIDFYYQQSINEEKKGKKTYASR